jgi:hypothetical protein
MNAKTYNQINELLSEYSRVNAEIEKAEGQIKVRQLKSAELLLPEHARLKVRLDELENELRRLSDANYTELFPDEKKRNHKTPFGELTYRKSSAIEFDDMEKVILKIKLECRKEAEAALREKRSARFTEQQFIRAHEEPNLDTLATADDSLLALFGFYRTHNDNFKVKPFTMRTDKPRKAIAEVEA